MVRLPLKLPPPPPLLLTLLLSLPLPLLLLCVASRGAWGLGMPFGRILQWSKLSKEACRAGAAATNRLACLPLDMCSRGAAQHCRLTIPP